ncbi:hypothetical protein HOLleu_36289 [Holothuria leucospilota]|uniref:Helix-turn-helix domain-containing protein n=1 Tax=Holothuria leucospilota TaxID=206669 RepID=A0A9Q0YJJ6_HOLLE|nr:hypothetical protein HOLleu_36289 [Holothuria leucospilota]
MNKEQYMDKMSDLIMEDKTYRLLKSDPTTSLENKIRKAIKELKEQNKLNKKPAKQLTPRNSLSPRIYGLPKVHKEGTPLRPIVSSINSPSYNLARHLAGILTPLSGKGISYIKNSQHFVERAKKISIETSDILVQKTDSKLSFSVYRKPTHTDQYLHFSSNHHVSAKINVVNTLLHRTLTLCDEAKVSDELDHITKALHKNDYPAHYVHRAVKKQTQQQITNKKASEEYNKGLTFMPYVKGVSERITRILNHAGVKTFYFRSQKLRDILSQPKDPLPKKLYCLCLLNPM